jgi:hypothetical protein
MKKILLTALLGSLTFIGFSQDCEIYREDFDGAPADYEEMLYPYGPSATCAFATGAVFENTGTEHKVTVLAYFEAALRKRDFDLPEAAYRITFKWRTEIDGPGRDLCTATNFDDLFGASCTVPNRIVVINGKMIHESPGSKNTFEEVVIVDYFGPIDSITLASVGNCATDPFVTYYDYITITAGSSLPEVAFASTVEGKTVTFIDSTTNADSTLYSWDFGDGNNSTEVNPIHTYEGPAIYKVCLTTGNICGDVKVCKFVEVSDTTTTFVRSNNALADVRLFPNPTKNNTTLQVTQGSDLSKVSLFSMSGRLLRSWSVQLSNDRVDLDLNDINPGVYMISAEVDGIPLLKRLIVQ